MRSYELLCFVLEICAQIPEVDERFYAFKHIRVPSAKACVLFSELIIRPHHIVEVLQGNTNGRPLACVCSNDQVVVMIYPSRSFAGRVVIKFVIVRRRESTKACGDVSLEFKYRPRVGVARDFYVARSAVRKCGERAVSSDIVRIYLRNARIMLRDIWECLFFPERIFFPF